MPNISLTTVQGSGGAGSPLTPPSILTNNYGYMGAHSSSNNTFGYKMGATRGVFTNSPTLQNSLYLPSASGFLLFSAVVPASTWSTDNHKIKITIDGNVVLDFDGGATMNTGAVYYSQVGHLSDIGFSEGMVPFNESIWIQAASGATSNRYIEHWYKILRTS